MRKIICGGIAGSGSLEVLDGSPVLQTGAVLEFISGCVNERSACTSSGDDILLWLRIPLERSSQSALAVRLSVPNGET